MNEDQANEVALLEAVIPEYVTNMTVNFIRGENDIDKEWDSYIAELNNMGLQDYVDLMQKIMDAQ